MQLTAPTQFQSLPAGTVTLNGTATDDIGVSLVRLVISEVDRRTTTTVEATLAAPGAMTTAWRYSAALPAAGCSVKAQAQDAAGKVSVFTTPRAFDVAQESGRAFLTLMFGRTQLAIANGACQALPNTVPLNEVARTLHEKGLVGTGSVVADYIAESNVSCRGYAQYPSWKQIADWRDSYGMRFTSAGFSHRNSTTRRCSSNTVTPVPGAPAA